jgi:hypothetical protein
VNGPVQLGLSLLQRLQRAILLQRDHNRFDLTSADDHLVISNLVTESRRTLRPLRFQETTGGEAPENSSVGIAPPGESAITRNQTGI